MYLCCYFHCFSFLSVGPDFHVASFASCLKDILLHMSQYWWLIRHTFCIWKCLCWGVFRQIASSFLSTWKMFLHCALTCLFSLAAFKVFWLSLVSDLTVSYVSVVFFMVLVLGACWVSWICGSFSSALSFSVASVPLLPSLLQLQTAGTLKLSHSSEAHVGFSSNFYCCAFKFTSLFSYSVWSAVNHTQCIFPLRLCSFHLWKLDVGLFFFFFFWLHHAAYEILVLQPGIKPAPPALEAWSVNHWTAREVPRFGSFIFLSCCAFV